MGKFTSSIKAEIRGLLSWAALVPLLAGILVIVLANISVGTGVQKGAVNNFIAVVDNDLTAQSSRLSSWLDTSGYEVQRFFNISPAELRRELKSQGRNIIVEFPQGFTKELRSEGHASVNTYFITGDFSVKSLMKINVLDRSIRDINEFANASGFTSDFESVGRNDWLLTPQGSVPVSSTSRLKLLSSAIINIQYAILILLTFTLLFFAFYKRGSGKNAGLAVSTASAAVIAAVYVIFMFRYIYEPPMPAVAATGDGTGFAWPVFAAVIFSAVSAVMALAAGAGMITLLRKLKNPVYYYAAVIASVWLFLLVPFTQLTVYKTFSPAFYLLPFSNAITAPANAAGGRYLIFAAGLAVQSAYLAIFICLNRKKSYK